MSWISRIFRNISRRLFIRTVKTIAKRHLAAFYEVQSSPLRMLPTPKIAYVELTAQEGDTL